MKKEDEKELLDQYRNGLKDYLTRVFAHDKTYPIAGTLAAIDRYSKNEDTMYKVRKLRPSAPAIALFCSIIHQSGFDKKGKESQEIYCMRICKKFDIVYTDNVRQDFNEKRIIKNANHLQEIRRLIIPFIPSKSARKEIKELLNSI